MDSAKKSDGIQITPEEGYPVDTSKNKAKDIIPDERPRKDGPGGEGSNRHEE